MNQLSCAFHLRELTPLKIAFQGNRGNVFKRLQSE